MVRMTYLLKVSVMALVEGGPCVVVRGSPGIEHSLEPLQRLPAGKRALAVVEYEVVESPPTIHSIQRTQMCIYEPASWLVGK